MGLSHFPRLRERGDMKSAGSAPGVRREIAPLAEIRGRHKSKARTELGLQCWCAPPLLLQGWLCLLGALLW